MREPESTIRQLLDRLLQARARRDGEVRFSDAWYAADREMHELERDVFRGPTREAARRARRLPSGSRLSRRLRSIRRGIGVARRTGTAIPRPRSALGYGPRLAT